MTTAVYFDLDFTLLQYTDDFETIFGRAIPDAPDGAYERYVEELIDAFGRLSATPHRDGIDAVLSEFDVGIATDVAVQRYYQSELDATTVPAQTRSALERVATHHPTGILTNGAPKMQRAKVEGHELDSVVDAVVVSNDPDVAARKPAGEIFAAAEDALPADEYVYVGDDYDEDIVGARRAGWDALHVGDDGPEDARRVASVDDAVARIV
ncbi:HAD family hydrolase [Haloferax sp. YSSS75]|uniref:HAD family hydrolase n=1 Tax=Haloferax sp. YSSS75 TaxID=3388564 RepID=UPI00398C8452